MATALLAGLLGLFGIVLGSILTTWTASQTVARSHHYSLMESRRKEYRSAVIRFTSALLAWRVAEMDRWFARHGGAMDEEKARRESHRMRAAMWNSYYELELSSGNSELLLLARATVEMVYSIRKAVTVDEMNDCSQHAREHLIEVIAAARLAEPDDPRSGSMSRISLFSHRQ